MFITFEGIEGSGKSTALNRLCDRLVEESLAFVRTREPGGSLLGRELRAMLLDASREICAEAELFLYLADRAQHMNDVVRPALAARIPVFSDRFADSTIVYQGYGRGLDVERLYAINDAAVSGRWPDLTLLFDLDPEEGLRRALSRNAAQGISVREGRFEAEALAFHQRTRAGYLDWAAKHPERFRVVNAEAPPEAVFAEVLAIVGPLLQLPV
jgi:dTMP kinase